MKILKNSWVVNVVLLTVLPGILGWGCATGLAYRFHVDKERQDVMLTQTIPLDGWKPTLSFGDFAAMNPGLLAVDALLIGGVAYWATDGFDFGGDGAKDSIGASVVASDSAVVTIAQGNAESRSKATSEASRSISTSKQTITE